MIEALPSERDFTPDGTPECSIAKPMIRFFKERLQADSAAASLLQKAVATSGSQGASLPS